MMAAAISSDMAEQFTSKSKSSEKKEDEYVKDFKEARKRIEEFELKTSTKFSCWKTETFLKPESEVTLDGLKIMFEDIKGKHHDQQLTFDGTPFVILGRKVYDCQYGIDRNISSKLKKKEADKQDKGDFHFKKHRFHSQNSKKHNCKAQIYLRDVILFPGYKAKGNTERHKRNTANKVKEDWGNGLRKETERRIYIRFPKDDCHTGHVIGEASGISQKVDGRVIDKIQELVAEGVKNVKEMERHLQIFVKKELFRNTTKPPTSSRRFFPKQKDIRNHMYLATVKLRFSKVDQANLDQKIKEWEKESPDDRFHFRGYGEVQEQVQESSDSLDSEIKHDAKSESCLDISDTLEEDIKVKEQCSSQRLLFVHQTAWQRHLLQRYGNHICLLDATYRTTKYALPLFFVVVKTNVDYQVIGSFVIQDETTDSIAEALQVLQSWNQSWSPKLFMTDNCDEEIRAIESNFSGCRVLLCDFHREQAWERWLSATSNGMRPHKEPILAMIRRIAKADTIETYEKSVHDLKTSPMWNADESKHFRRWFSKTWLPENKRWVWAFRKDLMEIVVNTNNGVERQNKNFKNEYLKDFKDKSLSGMVTVLVERFLPAKYNRYVESNTRSSSLYRRYNPDVPLYLRDRPKSIVKHCTDRLYAAREISSELIKKLDDVSFSVKKTKQAQTYAVNFGGKTRMPSCECRDWSKNQMPCKHFLAVMENYPDCKWDKFAEKYRQSPYFTLDRKVLFGGDALKTSENGAAEYIFTNEDIPGGNAVKGNENGTCIDLDDNFGNDEDLVEDTQYMKYNSLPQKDYKKRSVASKCREITNQIRSLTYLVYDEDALCNLEEQLSSVYEELLKKAPQDDGLILRQDIKVQRKVQVKKRYENIPGIKSRKRSWSGRVGEGAMNRKRAALLDITNLHGSNKQQDTIIEEPVPVEENIEDLYDINMWLDRASRPTKEHEDPWNIKENNHDIQTNGRSDENLEPKEDSEDDVIITGETVNTSHRPNRRKLRLSKEEEKCILQNDMLTDESINIAQNLLSQQFPEIDGFFDTVIGQTQSFPVMKSFRKYIQILHTGNLHWVCTANLDDKRQNNASSDLYDSLNSGSVSLGVACQMAAYSICPNSELEVKIKPVQQQGNSVDCGPFAIAFATSLAHNQDPCKIAFDQQQLRPHLLRCLQRGKMTPFPQLCNRKTCLRCRARVSKVELFCSCRMPWDPNAGEEKDMVMCPNCKDWFHRDCENVPSEIFSKPSKHKWLCNACKLLSC